MQRRLDRLALEQGFELEEVLGWTFREAHGREVVGDDVGHREGDEQGVVLVAVVAELVGDADLVLGDVEIFALQGDLAMADEFEPAGGENGCRVVSQGGRRRQCQKNRDQPAHRDPYNFPTSF